MNDISHLNAQKKFSIIVSSKKAIFWIVKITSPKHLPAKDSSHQKIILILVGLQTSQ